MRRFSLCGCPSKSSQVRSLNPLLSTTSVSPSHRPTEYPIQLSWALFELTAIHEDPAMREVLVQHRDERRRLDEFRLPEGRRDDCRSHRKTQRFHAVLAELSYSLLHERVGPRLHIFRVEIGADVVVVPGRSPAPTDQTGRACRPAYVEPARSGWACRLRCAEYPASDGAATAPRRPLRSHTQRRISA